MRNALVTPLQMADIDRQTIQEYGLNGQVLMETAARSCLEYIPEGRVLVLVGPGNNGGDGLVLARALVERGREVSAILAYPEVSSDANCQLERAKAWGVSILSSSQLSIGNTTEQLVEQTDVIIDALFGTGLSRPLDNTCRRLVELSNQSSSHRVAVDIPSGIHGETGQILGAAFSAHQTVTFGLRKWGHVLYPGAERCGTTHLTQPGFHPKSLNDYSEVQLVDLNLAAELLPRNKALDHKGKNGRLLLCTGSETYPGAGALSCLGAIHGGAGLTTLYSTRTPRKISVSLRPEIIPKSRENDIDPSNYDAVVLGCGLGEDTQTCGMKLLSRCERPTVVDADALSLVEKIPLDSREHLVLTPHPGELARLLKCSVKSLESDRINAAIQAAEQLRATICFKGAPTITANPSGRAWVNASGNSVLAQGGTGDLLAGIIGAYLAFGLEAGPATAAAVYIHGLAADLAVEQLGNRGVPASILSEFISRAQQSVCRDNLQGSSITRL